MSLLNRVPGQSVPQDKGQEHMDSLVTPKVLETLKRPSRVRKFPVTLHTQGATVYVESPQVAAEMADYDRVLRNIQTRMKRRSGRR
ncbi:hypothetical protein [Kocuria sp.]|uniref:hypothetical protein n=1 Tax=Kocuria sp. TaxID=1871328 RepID=UPI0026DFF8CD|nr:hypothetical protein [Kocuria sp.]MDO5619611.1 hypothetical protein [Kocuria sp.]